ncbi:MAG: DUF2977 domain-containing protein [Lactobacillus sp.]|nr:MAG: DUF2977 domain-containing protein [Lactobacillus sp.]
MQIEVNEKNEIQFYALSGKLNNGIEIDQSIVPTGFTVGNFKPGYYLYSNGAIVVNPNYVAPVLPTGPGLSDVDKAVATLTLQLAQNKANQDKVNAQLLLATAQQTAKETA